MKRLLILLPLLLLVAAAPPEPDPEIWQTYLPLAITQGIAGVQILDCDGNPATETWLQNTFGPVTWTRGTGPHLATIRCDDSGISALVVHVEDPDGSPVADQLVVRRWPDAPRLPEELAGWFDNGVYGPTNANGDIGFGMGHGDYYFPPAEGPSCIWLHPGGDLLCGLGMLGGTNHVHLNATWRTGDE